MPQDDNSRRRYREGWDRIFGSRQPTAVPIEAETSHGLTWEDLSDSERESAFNEAIFETTQAARQAALAAPAPSINEERRRQTRAFVFGQAYGLPSSRFNNPPAGSPGHLETVAERQARLQALRQGTSVPVVQGTASDLVARFQQQMRNPCGEIAIGEAQPVIGVDRSAGEDYPVRFFIAKPRAVGKSTDPHDHVTLPLSMKLPKGCRVRDVMWGKDRLFEAMQKKLSFTIPFWHREAYASPFDYLTWERAFARAQRPAQPERTVVSPAVAAEVARVGEVNRNGDVFAAGPAEHVGPYSPADVEATRRAFNLMGTVTGRLRSSGEPNMQHLPAPERSHGPIERTTPEVPPPEDRWARFTPSQGVREGQIIIIDSMANMPVERHLVERAHSMGYRVAHVVHDELYLEPAVPTESDYCSDEENRRVARQDAELQRRKTPKAIRQRAEMTTRLNGKRSRFGGSR